MACAKVRFKEPVATGMNIISNDDGASVGWVMRIEIGNHLNFGYRGSSTVWVGSPTTLIPNRWYELCIKHDGEYTSFYVNRQFTNKVAQSSGVQSGLDLVIGRQANASSAFYRGIISKIAVWNRLLYDSIIQQGLDAMVRHANPNLYYDFTSGAALDFSGNGYHGQVENVKFIGGKSLSGAYFDGMSYIEAGNLNSGAQQIIAGIEFAPYRKDKYQGLIGKWNSYALTTREWLMALFPHNVIRVYVADSSGSERLEYTTEDGVQKLIAVIDATRGVIELYKDKILVATSSITKTIQSTTTPLWVGQYGGSSKFYGIIKSTWVKWGQANNVLELFDNWGSEADLFYDFTSGSACDFSGNGNHGIIHGNVKFL